MYTSFSLPILLFIALTSVSKAQLPACAAPCIADAVSANTSCGADDLACQCSTDNASKIQSAATSCVLTACKAEAAAVLKEANAACSSVNAAASSTSTSTSTSTTESTATSTTVSTTVSSSAVVATIGTSTPTPVQAGAGSIVADLSGLVIVGVVGLMAL